MYKMNWIYGLFVAVFIMHGCSIVQKYPASKTDKKELEKKAPLATPEKEGAGILIPLPLDSKPQTIEKEGNESLPLDSETKEELREEQEPLKPAVPKADKLLPPSNPAVVSLIEKSREQQNKGLLTAAQNSLERAQRISPKDPEIYFHMADLRRRQGKFLEAAQLALKGVSVSGGYNSMLRRLWTLVAQIRKEGGDFKGAKVAQENAKELE